MTSNILSLKTAVYSSLSAIQNSDYKIDLHGLENGFWNDKLSRVLVETVVYR